MKTATRILSLTLALLLTAGLLWLAPAGQAADTDPFRSVGLTLDSALTVRFTVAVTDTENASMTFAVYGNTWSVPIDRAEHKGDDLYTFPCLVSAVHMADTITATLHDSGKTYDKQVSVQEYAVKLLASKQWDKLRAADLVVSTLHYGGALQEYAKHETGNLANAGYTLPGAPTVPEMSLSGLLQDNIDGITCTSASLVLRSNVAVRFYFRVDSGSIGDYTFQIGEKNYTPVQKDDKYYVEFSEINPAGYTAEITLTVTQKGTGATLSVKYSPMHYISSVYHTDGTEASLKTLLGRMYQYHTDAVSYVANPLGNDKDNIVSAAPAN